MYKNLSSYLLFVCSLLLINSAQANTEEDLEHFGDAMQFILPTAAFSATFIADDPEGRKQFYYSLVTAMGTTTALKGMYGKLRPESTSPTSYPSGHTTAVFQGAGFIQQRYGYTWGIPAYGLALLTGYSRIDSNNHFADDVLAGASVGLMANWNWVSPYNSKLSILPQSNGDSIGVSIHYQPDAKSSKTKRAKNTKAKGRYEVSQGSAFLQRNEIQAPTLNGTKLDFASFDLIDDPIVHTIGVAQWYTSERNTASIILAPFEARDVGRFTTPTNFNNKVFPANTPIRSSWQMTDLAIQYAHRWTAGNWEFNPALGLTALRTVVKLWTVDNSLQTRIKKYTYLPYIELAGTYNINRRVSIQALSSGSDINNDRYLSANLKFNYKINREWDAGFGFGRYKRTLNTKAIKDRVRYDLVSISLAHTFF